MPTFKSRTFSRLTPARKLLKPMTNSSGRSSSSKPSPLRERTIRMKKQLNVDQIQSELRGGSAFFPGYQGGTSTTPPAAEPREEHITPESEAKTSDTDQEGVPPPVPLGVPHTVPRPG